MYTGMYSTGSVASPALYFISFHFLTASLLLQLVIAIYVEAFETFSEEQKKEFLSTPAAAPAASSAREAWSPSSARQESSFDSTSLASQQAVTAAAASPPATVTALSATPNTDTPPEVSIPLPRKIHELPAYLFKQTSQKLFRSNSISSAEDQQRRSPALSPVPPNSSGGGSGGGRRDSLERNQSGYLSSTTRPPPLPLAMRHSSSSLGHNSRPLSSNAKPIHKFVRKSVIPKSAIHSLARVHMKEFEEDELEQRALQLAMEE